jgi:hypothetical protein
VSKLLILPYLHSYDGEDGDADCVVASVGVLAYMWCVWLLQQVCWPMCGVERGVVCCVVMQTTMMGNSSNVATAIHVSKRATTRWSRRC